ncbi:MAG: corA1 [Frankiales bacterium]|nr:corA1 [Frankiales bacterium]
MTTTRYAVTTAGMTEGDGVGFPLLVLVDPGAAELQALLDEMDVDELAQAEAREVHLRPQLAAHPGCLCVTVKTPTLDESSDVELGEVVALVAEDRVALVGKQPGTVVDEVVAHLTARGARLPAEVLLALVQVVTPDLDDVLVGLDEDVLEVEKHVFSAERADHTRHIYKLKRELLELRRATAPLAEVTERLATEPSCPVPEELREAFVEQQRRTARTASGVEHLDGLIDGVLDAQVAQIGVRQNEDQRRISAWAAIALVPTVVGGIYGMNFENMPELTWKYGYFGALTLIIGTCLSLYVGFRANGWLGPSGDRHDREDDRS